MSGGSHDYAYQKLNDIADSFYTKPRQDEHLEARKKVAKILNLMSEICHDIEWIDSCDYGEDDWKKVEELLGEIIIKTPTTTK
jgi:hypothetical protein